MKKIFFAIILLLFIMLIFPPSPGQARDIPPIVSTAWLQNNFNNPKLIILDVRALECYLEEHIPKALSSVYGAWSYKKDGLYSEVPEPDDLNDTIGHLGIGFDSWVVVYGSMDTPQLSYQSARVACTLTFAGVRNAAILDGGINKWLADKRPVSKTISTAKPKHFSGIYNKERLATKDYIKNNLDKLILLDVREKEYFAGEKKMDCVTRSGRIPGAFNLPTSCAFNKDKTFKSKEELAVLAEAVAGKDRSRQIVTYCNVGRTCPIWSYILKEVLDYTNVRIYDGAMQEWMQDPQSPVTK